MRIAVAVHGRFHAFELAGHLHARGLLAGLLTTYPAFAARPLLPPGVPLLTRPALELWRRLHARLGLPGSPDLGVARAFGRFAARRLPECDLLVGWSGASLEAIRAAHARGIKVVLERGSTHIAHQTELLTEAYARFGLPFAETDPRLVERELAEYRDADLICTGSGPARASFLERGVAADKVAANPYGVDLARFTPGPPRRAPARPRVLFVGRVGIRKGVPWLVEAFASLPPPWELHLVGPVERGFEAILGRLPAERVVLRGPLPGAALPDEFRAAEIFVLPSLEEGFGMVLLQAMAAGVACVASTATGGRDLAACGGVALVPPADAAALAGALATFAADGDLRRRMGALGRARVAAGFGWEDYGDRAVALYRRVLGESDVD
jgi:glycosyltransferase involved in cell wall biosynthesis